MLQAIPQAEKPDSIDKIVCRTKNACFIHGTKSGNERWYYSFNGIVGEKLDVEFEDSGYIWIDSKDKSVNDMYEHGKSIVYCTTAGLWLSDSKKYLGFDDGYSTI